MDTDKEDILRFIIIAIFAIGMILGMTGAIIGLLLIFGVIG